MSIVTWLRTPRLRRGIAASAVLLAAGGLILFRAPAGATPHGPTILLAPLGDGANVVRFSGRGGHGQIALSHTSVLAGTNTPVVADVRLVADAADDRRERAPLALAVVLDTSGSMEGEKIERAKEAALRLVRDMHDDDEIAFVRYDDSATVVQPLARLGSVREALVARVRRIEAGGGTAIPRGLEAALAQLERASAGRVRRVVLASDGLDSTRRDAERLATNAFEHGITVSSMGIGLDFDEAYMGSVARVGHGNFAFVQDASALTGFLHRELVETATTTIEAATVHLALPAGMRFVRASGADATPGPGYVDLRLGSLFAGDERRVVLELEASLDAAEERALTGEATWTNVSGGPTTVSIGRLALLGTTDGAKVARGRDEGVLANAASVHASTLQLEAAEAYERGDTSRAQALIDQSVADLDRAAAAAPAAAASALAKQSAAYAPRKAAMARPSAQGAAAAKKAVEEDSKNIGRQAW